MNLAQMLCRMTRHLAFHHAKSAQADGSVLALVWAVALYFAEVPPAQCAATFDIRLVDGGKPNEGRVEIRNTSGWETFCGDALDVNIAAVLCRQVGYHGVARVFNNSTEFGSGKGKIFPNERILCSGAERNLSDCSFGRGFLPECDHEMDAAIICHEPGYRGCYRADEQFRSAFYSEEWNITSVDECLTFCRRDKANQHAAVSGESCSCSRHCELPWDDFIADWTCDRPISCTQDDRQICGGPSQYSVYSTSAVFCEPLHAPVNGHIKGEAYFRFGSTITFSCSFGHAMRGDDKIQCVQSDGDGLAWSSDPPECRPILWVRILIDAAAVVVVSTIVILFFRAYRKCRNRDKEDFRMFVSYRNLASPVGTGYTLDRECTPDSPPAIRFFFKKDSSRFTQSQVSSQELPTAHKCDSPRMHKGPAGVERAAADTTTHDRQKLRPPTPPPKPSLKIPFNAMKRKLDNSIKQDETDRVGTNKVNTTHWNQCKDNALQNKPLDHRGNGQVVLSPVTSVRKAAKLVQGPKVELTTMKSLSGSESDPQSPVGGLEQSLRADSRVAKSGGVRFVENRETFVDSGSEVPPTMRQGGTTRKKCEERRSQIHPLEHCANSDSPSLHGRRIRLK